MDGPFPVMALVPTHRQMGLSYVPCVVTLDLAWIWSEETGDELYAADTAMSFAQSLGIGATRKNMMRVLSIIREHIEDMLKRIPPRPSDDRKIVGDFIARDQETGRERHMEIKE
jgi:hypothetical protein